MVICSEVKFCVGTCAIIITMSIAVRLYRIPGIAIVGGGEEGCILLVGWVLLVGSAEGAGDSVGWYVGDCEGRNEGWVLRVGDAEGRCVGSEVVGATEGPEDGTMDSVGAGVVVGVLDGAIEGWIEGCVDIVGEYDGTIETVGWLDIVGVSVGIPVGFSVGGS